MTNPALAEQNTSRRLPSTNIAFIVIIINQSIIMATPSKITKLTLQPPKAPAKQTEKYPKTGEMVFESPKKGKKAPPLEPREFDSSNTPSVFLDHTILQRRQRAAAKKRAS